MFPTSLEPNSKHRFVLKTVLKNPRIASEKINIGLNKIETVLKPQVTSFTNLFKRLFAKGNIDVNLRVNYQPS